MVQILDLVRYSDLFSKFDLKSPKFARIFNILSELGQIFTERKIWSDFSTFSPKNWKILISTELENAIVGKVQIFATKILRLLKTVRILDLLRNSGLFLKG